MLSRRGLFKLLAGALASPALAPLAKLLPESAVVWVATDGTINAPTPYYYDRAFLNAVRSNLPMTAMCKTYDLPPRSGKQIKFFTYLPEKPNE